MNTNSALCIFVFTSVAAAANAQCADWSPGFELGGLDEVVRDGATFDDGSGPALYVVGDFTAAGSAPATGIARWDGQAFTSVGSGLNGDARAVAVYDDGSGAALYVGGPFTMAGGVPASRIARWNGSSWSAVGGGLNNRVSDLVVFDDGSGADLYVAGGFTSAGGVSAWSVARWDGSAWSAMPGCTGEPAALAVFDDGNGARLYVASRVLLGSLNSNEVARWTGASWQVVGSLGGGDDVYTLEVHDDGSGSALYAGGEFTHIGGATIKNLARWRGGVWSSVGAPDQWVSILRSFDDGSGKKLFAGGRFQTIGGTPAKQVARWNGTSWQACGSGLAGSMNPSFSDVFSMTAFDDGSGPALHVGGNFSSAGGVATTSLAAWDGAWHALGAAGHGINGTVKALEAIDLGAGEELYAAGTFSLAGGVAAQNIARWNGTTWSALAGGLSGNVRDVCAHDDGSGPAVYAVGSIQQANGQFVENVARWNGSTWSPVGWGVSTSYFSDHVTTVASFDDGNGPALYVGGVFDPQFGASGECLVFWRAGAWHEMPAGEPYGQVNALAVFDDGSGPALYAGGAFQFCGSIPVGRVAKWDGVSWSDVDEGVSGTVSALAVFDDGSGPALYVGGTFASAGNQPASNVAKWNGSQWSALGSGCNAQVAALVAHDDGSGPALYAAGSFTSAGGVAAHHLARWNGASWSALAGSTSGDGDEVLTLASFDDGPGGKRSLYAAGSFAIAGNVVSANVARWSDPCACTGSSYCTSGVTSNGCVPTISGTGTASASASSGFTISISSVEGQKQGHIFYGVSGPHAAPWGTSSHFLCVKAPSQRTGTQDSGGTAGACDGTISLDWNAYCATHPGALGMPFSAGQSVWAQLYFRDPAGPKTTALSNALAFSVCP